MEQDQGHDVYCLNVSKSENADIERLCSRRTRTKARQRYFFFLLNSQAHCTSVSGDKIHTVSGLTFVHSEANWSFSLGASERERETWDSKYISAIPFQAVYLNFNVAYCVNTRETLFNAAHKYVSNYTIVFVKIPFFILM